jgi:hypothetical protein
MATSAIDGLKARQAELAALSQNPLNSPGAASTLRAIQDSLNRRKDAALGQARGRAVASGQGVFSGAMGSTATQLESDAASAFAQQQGDLALKLGSEARQLGVDLDKALMGNETAQRGQDITRYGIDTEKATAADRLALGQRELDANTATAQRGQDITRYGIDTQRGLDERRLTLSERELGKNTDLDLAKLKEAQRQFDVAGGRDERQFAMTQEQQNKQLAQQDRQFGTSSSQQDRQFATSSQQAQQQIEQIAKKLSLAEQEANFQRLKDMLAISIQGYEIGVVPESGIGSRLNALGLPSQSIPRNPGNVRPDIWEAMQRMKKGGMVNRGY